MSEESDALGVKIAHATDESPRPRRIRLAKAMIAVGRAKEARSIPATSQLLRSRSCKLSHADEIQLDILKRRLASQGIPVKKGELLRAALWLLADADDARLREAIRALDETAPPQTGLAS